VLDDIAPQYFYRLAALRGQVERNADGTWAARAFSRATRPLRRLRDAVATRIAPAAAEEEEGKGAPKDGDAGPGV